VAGRDYSALTSEPSLDISKVILPQQRGFRFHSLSHQVILRRPRQTEPRARLSWPRAATWRCGCHRDATKCYTLQNATESRCSDRAANRSAAAKTDGRATGCTKPQVPRNRCMGSAMRRTPRAKQSTRGAGRHARRGGRNRPNVPLVPIGDAIDMERNEPRRVARRCRRRGPFAIPAGLFN